MAFLDYQVIRQSIKTSGPESFKNKIKDLPENEKIGLWREYRAYKWLKSKYSNQRLAVSNAMEDADGIDFVIETNNGIINFAVSGPADMEPHLNCHYKIIVTDNKIYQKKVNNE